MPSKITLHSPIRIASRQYYLFTVTGADDTVLEVFGFDISEANATLEARSGMRELCKLPLDYKTVINGTIDKIRETTGQDWGIKEVYVSVDLNRISCSVLAMRTE
ncbi:hypothetical protein BDZ91DRAFT_733599 [Kalaharituber pfeilii]|nr:hypothetical protein BDZ91DRAFT_733599 [Kalaharituber pfeilii]